MKASTLRQAFRELSKELGTSIAGHILAFDTETQLAQVQVGIFAVDAKGKKIKPDPIIECPVEFSGGGGWSFEHELKPNDEGLIIFSQRCLDAWIQTGGMAENPIARFHDKQDACFIPGVRSKKNAIKDFQNNGIRLRNEDASVYHWLKNDGSIESVNGAGYIKLLASGVVDMNGFLVQPTGAATSPVSVGAPTMTAANSLTVAGKEMDKHNHEPGTYVAGTTNVTGQSGDPV
ncbi:putative baseplate assembly protein [Vibrio phage 191E37-1]|nr:putative baseplate assembly protein [Vibrio phage 191E37-1]